ncbi:MAG: pentapeptide repeat-containing protein, partial [Oscillospiraceae bacterium]|nr:pentapeptide repeat-containing protein [Oscillospiraceae bacterium]
MEWLQENWAELLASLSGLGGVAAVFMLFINGNANRKAEKRQVNMSNGERLRQAIEHLGHADDTIKQGACYEFKRLAEDSQRDRKSIAQLLTTYVRNTLEQSAVEPKYNNDGKLIDEKDCVRPADSLFVACAILSFLFQKYEIRADLHSVTATLLNLSEIELRGANLYGANFKRTFLQLAHLEGAHLASANLLEANLSYACLEGAVLWLAHLDGADLASANLLEANLSNAYLDGAGLVFARLQGADLSHAYLEGANLWLVSLDNKT